MSTKYLLFLCFLLSLFSINAQNFPGGVTGAEVWYMGNWDDIPNAEFLNSAQTDILITKCGERYDKDLFNFNPSIISDKLCIMYTAALENSTGRNIFFVGEPHKEEHSYSHVGTSWNDKLEELFPTDSIIRNFFDFNNKSIYSKEILEPYLSDNNARINFYHTNHYNIDKKFKSYGEIGETDIFIGKLIDLNLSGNFEDEPFDGNFPEFISFPRELSYNERNRVESYLALKYGLTLSELDSYISSRNIVFWNKGNNEIFNHRIFGFGRDDISGLNQLQSESTHLKEHLVSAIEKILDTNMDKQEQTNIPNNHFLVFGDNGKNTDLANENNKKVKFWKKVWLAQRTGKYVYKLPIHFKLFLDEEILEYLDENPEESLWLMHDKFIGNDEVSEFDSENLEYYAGSINVEEGFAYFEDINFDDDNSIYDQFTFGVGPQMIVQAQIVGCKEDRIKVILDITGGRPKYTINVESEAGDIEDSTEESTYAFNAEPNTLYQVTVRDDQGIVVQLEFTPEPWDFSLDLGGTQYLGFEQQEIILDAGVGIDDPNATYQWYLNENLLPHTESTLLVSEPGDYVVTVTSADLSCSISDKATIEVKGFKASVSITQLCGSEYSNTIFIEIERGIPPFVTYITGEGGASVNHVHSGSTSFNDLSYGTYHITITDSVGSTFTDSVEFIEAEEIVLDLYTQLGALCLANNYDNICLNFNYPDAPFFIGGFPGGVGFSLDASLGVSNQNVEYQWYIDDESTGIPGPVLTLEPGSYCTGESRELPMFTVVATDIIFDCVDTQSFITKDFCPNQNSVAQSPNSNIPSQNAEANNWLKTAVYPNPTEKNRTFIYEVFATKNFSGTVELYSISGARLYSIQTNNTKNLKLPFNLNSAGVYLIKITTSQGEVKTDRIIIN